jgi:hypothetical protein
MRTQAFQLLQQLSLLPATGFLEGTELHQCVILLA